MTGLGKKKRWRNVEFKVISSSAAKKYPDTEGQKGGGNRMYTAVQPGKEARKKGRL